MERKVLSRVIYEKDPPIARIIMNYPERANVQDSAMVWDIDNCLKEAEKDWDVKLVILKGNGNGFCAGHALRGPAEGVSPYPEIKGETEHIFKAQGDLHLWPMLYFWEFPKPVISQVHGYCIGGGTYLAYLSDITIASEDAYFQMPLVQGLGIPGGQTMVEPWAFMNWKRTAEYLYTARTLTAQEAMDMGLVNRVVPREKLEETTEMMARHIAQAPGSALMMTKTLIKRAWELMGLRMHLQMSNDVRFLTTRFSDSAAHVKERMQQPRPYARDFAAKKEKEATPKNGKKK